MHPELLKRTGGMVSFNSDRHKLTLRREYE